MFRGMYRGSGQGGGGSVDYSRVVEKIAVIPSAETATVGKVYMYMGESNATYTHGYIYECVATQTATAVSFSGNIVSSWAVADFVSYLQEGGSAYNEVTHGTLTYDASGGLWDLVGYDANGLKVMSFHEYTEDLEDFGCVFASSTHQDGDSCQFTMTTEQSGKKWKRLDVQPGGEGGGTSGDPHNLGWYATESALTTAHPTAEAGDWAIVGATDTVWIWDTDNNEWVDSDQKGQVTSVNNQTGAVTLTASDVCAATAAQGAKADTAVQPADLATVATTGAYSDLSGKPTIPEATQVSTMPTAGVSELGKIYQYTGTTDANYTNGYFYKCVSDGQDPATYSWTAIQVQASSGGLPSQTGNAGKFLTTDGTDASWGDALVNRGTGVNATAVGTGLTVQATGAGACAFGNSSRANNAWSVSVGYAARSGADNTIQLCATPSVTTNSDANTFKVANANGNFEIMSADGTIPSDRLVHAINKYSTMPTAASTNEGWIVQFTGTTDSTYTHGHLYECVSDGADPATYSWTEVQLGGGGSSYTAGTGIDITSGVISITSPTLQNYTTATKALQLSATAPSTTSTGSWSNAFGDGAYAKGLNSIAIGRNTFTDTNTSGSIVIGNHSSISNTHYGSIVIGGGGITSQGAGTFAVGLSTTGAVGTWNTYKILDSDGTIPEARLADTTNATQGQVLTLDANLNAVWTAGGSGGGISDVTVNGVSVVSGGVAAITCATIDDTSTTSTSATWSASKLNTTIGNIETLLAAI